MKIWFAAFALLSTFMKVSSTRNRFGDKLQLSDVCWLAPNNAWENRYVVNVRSKVSQPDNQIVNSFMRRERVPKSNFYLTPKRCHQKLSWFQYDCSFLQSMRKSYFCGIEIRLHCHHTHIFSIFRISKLLKRGVVSLSELVQNKQTNFFYCLNRNLGSIIRLLLT